MKVIDYAPGEPTLCGVDAHEALRKERDELRAVIRDLVEGRGLTVTEEERGMLDYALKILKADGCHECASGREDGDRSYHAYHHDHHPDDRAHAYRRVLGAPNANGPVTTKTVLVRILEVLVRT